MPVGHYLNFAACVADQMNKGHSAVVARKICGQIEKNTKQHKGRK